MKSRPEKLKKKIERLRKKGKFEDAIKLQREICQLDESNANEWTALAEIAKEGNLLDIHLASRFCAAKLNRVGPDEWMELAEAAQTLGFKDDTLDARFRAAEAAALMGDVRRAVEFCDLVLELDPKHRPTQRIRGMMISRLERLEEEKKRSESVVNLKSRFEGELPDSSTKPGLGVTQTEVDDWDEEKTFTFIARGTNQFEFHTLDDDEVHALEEMTKSEWLPLGPDVGSEKEPTLARYVCFPQSWPTVLNDHCLMFVGNINEVEDQIAKMGEPITFSPGASVYVQGTPGQLLYFVDSGTLQAHRERGIVQDFGTISPGAFFGEVGTISGLPATTTVTTIEESIVRVVSREKLNHELHKEKNSIERVVSSLKSFYLETVFSICPLFKTCDDDELQSMTANVPWVTFQAKEMICEAKSKGALYVIVMGVAKIIQHADVGDHTLGFLSTGDLIGSLTPSPVSVCAESVVFAISFTPEKINTFPAEAQKRFDDWMLACNEAL